MSDQAQALRNKVMLPAQEQSRRSTRIITVSSGKGGVGKSNFTLNFALTLQARGYRVLIFDADIGMANINVLLGASPKYSLFDVLRRDKSIEEIIYSNEYGIQFVTGGSGFNNLINLSERDLNRFVQEVTKLSGKVDFILFDTGAGLTKETVKFILSAQETILVTTPEPTAITDAYAVIKMAGAFGLNVKFRLVINRITSRNEGSQTADKISMVAKQFLGMDIPTLGYISDDINVSRAVKKQIPFSIAYPNCIATKSMEVLVDKFLETDKEVERTEEGVKQFFNRLLRFIK